MSKIYCEIFLPVNTAELVKRIYLYFNEVNAEPVVFHWKYNLDDIDVSDEIIVDTLLHKKSG